MSKKFILFVVEGKNDQKEIEAIIHLPYYSALLDRFEPRFLIINGDITADVQTNSKKILERLNKLVLDFRRNGDAFSNIKVQDIQRVIHIVDMDGAFIPEDNIKKGTIEFYQYTEDAMLVPNVQAAVGRNRKKAEVLRKLINTTQIGNIPYQIYFVSCNMDHFLFDDRMSDQNRKRTNAWKFQNICQVNPRQIERILSNELYISREYYESWELIQRGTQSLQRKTNINLFLEEACFYQ